MFTHVRVEQPTTSKCRVVLDFTALRRYRITAVEKPNRIVVEASRTDSGLPKGLLAEAADIAEPLREGAAPTSLPVNLAEQLGLTIKTITIDAGHGGRDPGTQHNGIVERSLTLKVANLVAERLRKQSFTVNLTRTRDEFITLDRRTQFANEKKADLFLSIHVNANRDTRVCGFESYYLDYARTESASSVASRENAASGKSLNEIQSILAELIGRSKTQESLALATLIQENTVGSLRRKNFTAYDNGVRSALFLVLIGAQMPSVLLELGYCTNPAEAKRLNSDAYLATMADGIVQGILAYRDELNRLKR
jgi:N-acetylmuramoyl-L-alanine amidase